MHQTRDQPPELSKKKHAAENRADARGMTREFRFKKRSTRERTLERKLQDGGARAPHRRAGVSRKYMKKGKGSAFALPARKH
jgi:hypothetical protein